MHRLICLSRQLLEVADFVMAQEDNLLGYNIKLFQSYNQEFGIPALEILIVLIFESKLVVWILD